MITGCVAVSLPLGCSPSDSEREILSRRRSTAGKSQFSDYDRRYDSPNHPKLIPSDILFCPNGSSAPVCHLSPNVCHHMVRLDARPSARASVCASFHRSSFGSAQKYLDRGSDYREKFDLNPGSASDLSLVILGIRTLRVYELQSVGPASPYNRRAICDIFVPHHLEDDWCQSHRFSD